MDNLWAGWRSEYVSSAGKDKAPGGSGGDEGGRCVFCSLIASDLPARETNVVWRDDSTIAILNAYPYGTGHLLVMPTRHVGDLDLLDSQESAGLWRATNDAVAAVKVAYRPDGTNVGANLGAAAGAGIPEHLHFHVLPRWSADTNFMTSVANARVLPEALSVTWEKLTYSWPSR